MRAILRKIAGRISNSARESRAKLFRDLFDLNKGTSVLDLGSQDGKHVARILQGTEVEPQNVSVADLDLTTLQAIEKKFGYKPVPIGEDGKLPLDDGSVDIVFCSSVIEHVTIDKDEVWSVTDGEEFRGRSFTRQKAFADEIRRVGRGYFVQTPNRYFPIESHTWLPFAGFLPRRMLISAIKFANRFWVFYSVPDFNLLDKNDLARLFPDAELIFEKRFGLIKSIMAVKTEKHIGKKTEIRPQENSRRRPHDA